MIEVRKGLNIKSISDIIGREIRGIYETNQLTKEQKIKYIKSKYDITKKTY